MECPVCGGYRDKNIDETKRLLNERGVRSVMHDPGGIAIVLADGREFRLCGECNACDELDILTVIKPLP